MKYLVVLPARYQSKRLPGKALLELDGLPLIIHTAKRAQLSKLLKDVFVCTDSGEIINVCKKKSRLHSLRLVKLSDEFFKIKVSFLNRFHFLLGEQECRY